MYCLPCCVGYLCCSISFTLVLYCVPVQVAQCVIAHMTHLCNCGHILAPKKAPFILLCFLYFEIVLVSRYTQVYLCLHLRICAHICVCVYICVFVRTPSPWAAPSVSLRPPMEFCRVPNTALVACTALYLFPTPSVGSTCFPVFSFHASSNLSHFFTVFPPTRCPLRGGGW